MRCPNCGSEQGNSRFCGECGADVIQATASPMVKCPVCRREQSAGTGFCNNCNAALAPQSTAAPTGVTCPVCRKSFPAGTVFCGNCGTNIAGNARQSQSVPPPQPQFGNTPPQNFQSQNQYGGNLPPQNPYQQNPNTNAARINPADAVEFESLSSKSLVWGIVSLVCLQFLGFLAIIYAKRALTLSRGKPYSKGKAIAGLVLGILALVTFVSILLNLVTLIPYILHELDNMSVMVFSFLR